MAEGRLIKLMQNINRQFVVRATAGEMSAVMLTQGADPSITMLSGYGRSYRDGGCLIQADPWAASGACSMDNSATPSVVPECSFGFEVPCLFRAKRNRHGPELLGLIGQGMQTVARRPDLLRIQPMLAPCSVGLSDAC